MSLRMLPYGDRAVLAELDSLGEAIALGDALRPERPDGIVDVIPGARTVAVLIDPAITSLDAARTWVLNTTPRSGRQLPAGRVTIEVVYDGPDLKAVACLLGRSVEEVVNDHTGSTWRVAFNGFALGFGYLVTDHERLVVPRRSSPRSRVPAGSVALAGAFSGIYPREAPGGWQLIGRTDAVLFDSGREPPVLLAPGTEVRFVGVARRGET